MKNLIGNKIAGEAADPTLLAARAGFTLDAWQSDLLRSRARQIILNCSRQSGKSTMCGLLALHTALYAEGALVLILGPTQRQAVELFRKLKDSLNSLRVTNTQIEEESALRVEFTNRSRVVALPGKESTVRGFSNVALLIVDEAARVPDDLYHAVRPMLAVSGGRIVLLSTPFGKRGFFYNEWANAGADWERVKITARQCARISPEWLEAERRRIGAHWFASEYECQFIDTVDQVFSSADVERALDPTLKPLFL